jgi:hypothetical protein
MSTFYLLPPRRWLADHLTDCVGALLPGVAFDVAARQRLCALLLEAIGEENVLIIHREDLPAGEGIERALIDGCGAGPGDEIIEVRPGSRPGQLTSRRWRIVDTAAGSRAA